MEEDSVPQGKIWLQKGARRETESHGSKIQKHSCSVPRHTRPLPPSHPNHTIPRHPHRRQNPSINRIRHRHLRQLHTPKDRPLHAIMPQRHRQAHHTRIVPALLPPVVPRSESQDPAQKEPRAERARGEGGEVRAVGGGVVGADCGGRKNKGDVAGYADEGGLDEG
ncbi:uncharacterized protein CC84DRAFT_736591 [Paraphaeosphaeria sporulosa]|uniref:Uncharacterized protein n=1 Tax=Paraphaeosphaeria sporulosa TaxID=1460663 RepID=A0A177CE03_9PLEO|nr:uncharacterized protein CC84DRAFT_736591 [Paraphaeosphaeria sporulosa]OAG05855.1 hypothetical protein CC84DRAFT_736591 [Paraphaeosphaeria sporulosa]